MRLVSGTALPEIPLAARSRESLILKLRRVIVGLAVICNTRTGEPRTVPGGPASRWGRGPGGLWPTHWAASAPALGESSASEVVGSDKAREAANWGSPGVGVCVPCMAAEGGCAVAPGHQTGRGLLAPEAASALELLCPACFAGKQSRGWGAAVPPGAALRGRAGWAVGSRHMGHWGGAARCLPAAGGLAGAPPWLGQGEQGGGWGVGLGARGWGVGI